MKENPGALEYEVNRLTILQRAAHTALDDNDVPRRRKEGDEDFSLATRIWLLADLGKAEELPK